MTNARRSMAFAAAGLAALLSGCRISKSTEGVCFAPLFKIVLNRPGVTEGHVVGGGWHQGQYVDNGCTVLGTPVMVSGCTVACSAPACAAPACHAPACAAPACSAPACVRGPQVETLPVGANGNIVVGGAMLSSGDGVASGTPVPMAGPTTSISGYSPNQGYSAPVQSAPFEIAPPPPPQAAPIVAPGNAAPGTPAPPAAKAPEMVRTPADGADNGTKAAKPIPAAVQTLVGIAMDKEEMMVGESATFGVECRNTGGAAATGLSVRIKCAGATPLAVVRQDIAADGKKTNVGAKGRIDGDTVVFEDVESLAGGAGAEFQFTFSAKAIAEGVGKFEVTVRHSALPAGVPEVKEKTFRIRK